MKKKYDRDSQLLFIPLFWGSLWGIAEASLGHFVYSPNCQFLEAGWPVFSGLYTLYSSQPRIGHYFWVIGCDVIYTRKKLDRRPFAVGASPGIDPFLERDLCGLCVRPQFFLPGQKFSEFRFISCGQFFSSRRCCQRFIDISSLPEQILFSNRLFQCVLPPL